MMLKTKIREDLTGAMKNGDKGMVETLRSVISAISVEEKKQSTDFIMTDEGVELILLKQIKDRRNSISEFTKGGRMDLVEKEETQIKIIENYTPKPFTDEEIRKIITNIVTANNYHQKDFGKIMRDFNSEYGKYADGKAVSNIVREIL